MKVMRLTAIILVTTMLALASCVSMSSTASKEMSETESIVRLPIVNSDVQLYYNMIDKAAADGIEIDGQYLYDNYISKGSEGIQASYQGYKELLLTFP